MKRGFTLIEILVSVAIFSVVMVIALGALLAMSVSDRKAETIKTVANDLNFTLDSMSRDIRTGYGYNCGSSSGHDCTSGASSFYFTTSSGASYAYRFDNLSNDSGATANCGQTSAAAVGCIERSTDGGVTWFPLTAPEVIVSNGTFYVRGSLVGSADNTQPIVSITLSAYVVVTGGASSASQCGTAGNQCSQFYLQTSITQRAYDQ